MIKKYLLFGVVLCFGSVIASESVFQPQLECETADAQDCCQVTQTQSAEAIKLEQLFQVALRSKKPSIGKRVGIGAVRELIKIIGAYGLTCLADDILPDVLPRFAGLVVGEASPYIAAEFIHPTDTSLTELRALNKALAEMPAQKCKEFAAFAVDQKLIDELRAKLLKEKDSKNLAGCVWALKALDVFFAVLPIIFGIVIGAFQSDCYSVGHGPDLFGYFKNMKENAVECYYDKWAMKYGRYRVNSLLCWCILPVLIAVLDGGFAIKGLVDGTNDDKKAKLFAEIQARLAAK